jgi:hypothetical protein
VRPLHEREQDTLAHANRYFRDELARPAITALNPAYENWRARFSMTEDWSLGPLPESLISEPLVAFLLTWRMTLDQLTSEVSRRFGKDSPQWEALNTARRLAYESSSAYRVVEFMRNLVAHHKMPPITRSRTHPPHGERPRLTVTVPATWLLDSPNCPRLLRADLARPTVTTLDMDSTVSEAYHAFQDVLQALIVAENPNAPGYLEMFHAIAKETAPAAPAIMQQWFGEKNDALMSVDRLEWLQWASETARPDSS